MVYLAENIVLNNLWAIKTLKKSNQWLSVEMDEIEILKGLSHPMLPRIADMAEDEENYYIIMDYIEGTNVSELLNSKGTISQRILIKWTSELLDVLNYLHQRTSPIIYRDLKPGNLIVDDSGRLRLVDFGSARFHNQEAKDDTVYIGTKGYAAPEQYGTGQSDHRTDLFNLGMTLFHLATGTHPSKISPECMKLRLKRAGISKNFSNFILKLTQISPGRRFQSCSQAMIALSKIERPMGLYERKIASNLQEKEFRGIIGIGSMLPSCGVTSFALNLGLLLSQSNIKTALIELNNSGDFDQLRDVFDSMGMLKLQTKTKYEVKNMVMYPNASEFGEVSRKGIDATIMDLGALNSEKKIRDFNRADIKLIICPRVSWKYKYISEWIQNNKKTNGSDWAYLAIYQQNNEKNMLERLLNGASIVFCSDLSNGVRLDKVGLNEIGRAFDKIKKITGYA